MPNDIVAEFMKRMNKDLAKKVKKGETGIEITTGDDVQLVSHVPFAIPSGIPQFELAIGKPGYPAGRIIEFFGFESCGKTTAALQALASCQRLGGMTLYIDTECAFGEGQLRAKRCGVDIENLQMPKMVNSIEGVVDCIDSFLTTLEDMEWRGPSMIVVDSITAVESEGNSGKKIREDVRPGQDARVIRRALRSLNSRIADRKACMIFINHAISNIGGFGSAKTSSGGHALKFWASIRVDFTFLNQLTTGKKETGRTYEGQQVLITVRKNKVAKTSSPEFEVPNLTSGFDIYVSLLEAFRTIKVVEDVSTKSFHYTPSGTTFQRAEWKALVDNMGGPHQVYDFFLDEAQKRKFILPYGEDSDTELLTITPVDDIVEDD